MNIRRSHASRGRASARTGRPPRAWHDPALWAWVAVAVFALLPLTHVMASPLQVQAALASEGAPGAVGPRQDQASAGGGGTP